MEAFQWKPCFITGLTDIDEQHHRLVDVINQFGNLVMQEGGASTQDVEAVFSELADYARYHFSEEEALMVTTGVDERYREHHQKIHAKFLDEVALLHASVTTNRAAAQSLLQFMTHWLAYHILGSDQFLAKQIADIQAGIRPEDAYLVEGHHKDPATDALLSALDGLFQQVSERNEELIQLNRTLEARVEQRTQELIDANQKLDDLANTDVLTGLPNRRYALRCFATAWEESIHEGKPISCMMIDADGFKSINDRYGHDAGDVVLRALSTQLQHATRTDDIVCRLGGDEFLIICADTPLEGAMKLAENIRAVVGKLRISTGSGEWQGSISVGVACRTPAMNLLDELIKSADQAVYIAKRNGRNRVEVFRS